MPRINSPVEDPSLDLVVEAVQRDIVLHKRLHLGLVREEERRAQAASFRDRKSNNAAACTKLESVEEASVWMRLSGILAGPEFGHRDA